MDCTSRLHSTSYIVKRDNIHQKISIVFIKLSKYCICAGLTVYSILGYRTNGNVDNAFKNGNRLCFGNQIHH